MCICSTGDCSPSAYVCRGRDPQPRHPEAASPISFLPEVSCSFISAFTAGAFPNPGDQASTESSRLSLEIWVLCPALSLAVLSLIKVSSQGPTSYLTNRNSFPFNI